MIYYVCSVTLDNTKQNFLVCEDFSVKICDFDCAKLVGVDSSVTLSTSSAGV